MRSIHAYNPRRPAAILRPLRAPRQPQDCSRRAFFSIVQGFEHRSTAWLQRGELIRVHWRRPACRW